MTINYSQLNDECLISNGIINPVVYEKNGRARDIFSNNLEKRIIHFTGEVTDDSAASIVSQLLYLDSENHDDIYLYINSPGGSVTAGMAIYDTMQYIDSDVVTVCVGCAASMGAVILSGGTKGKRLILPHAEVMIHQPLGGAKGQATEIIIAAEHIKKAKRMINEILAENTGKDMDTIAADTDRDRFMDAKEAIEYGIVDKICKKRQSA